MTTTGQKLVESAKEALAFARGEPNECVNTDAKCPAIPVQDMESLA